MTTRAETLLALATKCEEATGPDRDLDLAIYLALYPKSDIGEMVKFRRGFDGLEGYAWEIQGQSVVFEKRTADGRCPHNGGYPLPMYTLSLDAALSLVPERWWLTLDRYSISDSPSPDVALRTWRVWLKYLAGDVEGDGPCGIVEKFATGQTPALALCAASLRALAAMEEGR